jgi:hypothetical protein
VPPFGPFKGKNLYQITVHGSKAGEKIDLEFHGSEGVMGKWSAVPFTVNANYGNVVHPLTLRFKAFTPPPPAAPEPTTAPPTAEPAAPAFDHTKFEDSFTATIAALEHGKLQSDGTLECMKGSEVRGIAIKQSPPFGPYLKKTLYAITCYGDKADQGAMFTTRYTHPDGKTTAWKAVPFHANANFGNAKAPIKMNFH